MASPGTIRAGQAAVELSLNDTALQAGLNKAKATLASFGKSVAGIGGALAAGAATITAPFLYGLSAFAEMGKEVVFASRETGIGFEQMGALAYALGGDIEGAVK